MGVLTVQSLPENVVVGIGVNAISEVGESKADEETEVSGDAQTQLRKELGFQCSIER